MEIMKKITNSERNTYTLKILETPKYLILNDQLYDKSDLSPIKFEILDNNDLTFTSWIFILKRFIFTNYRNTNRYFEQLVLSDNYGMIEDIKYPNRFYIIGQRTTCSGFLKILEETKDENTGKIYFKNLKEFNINENAWVHTWNPCGGGTCATKEYWCGGYSIIHQEDDYLLIKQHYPVAWGGGGAWYWRSDVYAGNRCTLFKLNKNDFSTFSISDTGNINEDASYNYFYLEHYNAFDYIYINWHLNHYIIKFDPAHNTTPTTIYDNPETGCDITCNPVKISDYYYYLVDEYKRTGNYGYQLCRFKMTHNDDMTETIDSEYINIIDNHKMDIDRSAVMANITHPLIHDCHTIQLNNGTNYMVIVARSQPNGEWYSPQHKLVVLRIEENQAIITQVVEFKTNPCRGVLSYYEEEGHADVLITLHTSCFMIWKFDYEQEKYINTFTRNGVFYAMGLDEQQRLYVQDSSTGIQMFDKIETSIAKVYFNEEVINEDAETTTLCFWTKNYFNEYTKENVIINLYNGIEFEDGSIEKEFQTSISGPTEVTVIINAINSVKAQATIAVISKIEE